MGQSSDLEGRNGASGRLRMADSNSSSRIPEVEWGIF